MRAVGRQLYIRVGASGSRSWVFRYGTGNHKKDHGIGSALDVSRDAER
jgi:hypothetical protein